MKGGVIRKCNDRSIDNYTTRYLAPFIGMLDDIDWANKVGDYMETHNVVGNIMILM